MNLILPAAGKSSRFPNMRPKWLLTHPNGNLMITESLLGLDLKNVNEIFIIVLEEHLNKYGCKHFLKKELNENLSVKINLIELKSETKSQSETIYIGVNKANISGEIFIKDCDNKFSTKINSGNYVSYIDVGNFGLKNLKNKSYLLLNEEKNKIESLVEKKVVSNLACISGYSFEDSNDFVKSYEDMAHLEASNEVFVSSIVNNLIVNHKKVFGANEVFDFVDWGTLEDWQDYKDKYITYFVDIDGVLFENGSKHFLPTWGKSKPILENIKVIKELYNSSTCEIILTTSRTNEFKVDTVNQLEEYGIKYHNIIFGLQHNKRVIINDFSSTNKYPSCIAINIERNSADLKKFIKS